MTHLIPAPRPSSDPLHRPLPPRGPLVGPACVSCSHPSCRRRRAQRLPRLGGHLAEYVREHALADSIQSRHPGLVVWFGEATLSYWVAGPNGLTEAPDARALTLLLRKLLVHG